VSGLEDASPGLPSGTGAEPGVGAPLRAVFALRGVTKTYGATTALHDVSLATHAGEVVGLIGANGAGKSTLTRVLSGVTLPDAGELLHAGARVPLATYAPAGASALGVRVVYQELSLCTNLDVCENFYVEQHATLGPVRGWRRRMFQIAQGALDEVFPGHGIDPRTRLAELSIAQRQMVEIARAVSMPGLELLILDEPTSSLGASQTAQLMAALGRMTARDVSVLFISHRLGEILGVADRIVVMRNGAKVWEGANQDVNEATLVERMTGEALAVASPAAPRDADEAAPRNEAVFVRTQKLTTDVLAGLDVHLHGGELVGVAGLEASGQREFLRALYFARHRGGGQVAKAGRLAYVTGDRSKEGIFPLWSILDNMSLVEVGKSHLFRGLDLRALAEKVGHWFGKLSIKAPGADTPIVALSGGNQQKVLVARALLAEADVIVLDDPTKGVDVGTKHQMRGLFREAAESGKLVLWYSTEDAELEICSRVLVFRYGRIVKELAGPEVTKQRIIEASFAGEDLLVRKEAAAQRRRPPTGLLVPIAAMLAVFLLSGALQPGVFSAFGIDLLLAGSIPLICSALAQMFVVGLSQIDLGVGAFMGLVSVLCATALHDRPVLGLAALVLSVAAYGAMGALILVRRIPAVIVTMGMSFVWTGIGMTLQDSPGGEAPQWLMSAFSLPLPVPESVVIVVLLGMAAHAFYRSRYGTVLRGFGNNPLAVERSGWSPVRAVAVSYGLASLFAMVGGMAITAASGASDINSTRSYTLLTVAAVVMGGSELLGGIVSPWGTIVGAITLSLLGALIGFLRLSSSYVTAVQGLILIGILASRLLRKVKT
jgi:ribose transport system ATP-binding protein